MRQIYVALCLLLMLAACTETPPDTVIVPTLAELPTLAPSTTPTITVMPSPTLTAPPTLSATPTATVSQTPRPTVSITPSATITDTPSPTFTASPSPAANLGSLAQLALTAAAATVLPPTLRPPVSTPILLDTPVPIPGTSVVGATFTPLPVAPVACPWSLPAALNSLLAGDPGLSTALGCPSGTPVRFAGAAQVFQNGMMYYLDGAPRSIYVLTIDGRYHRYDDTWVQGVDPDSGGEVPPPGLIEPIRGFGKVWRQNPDVRTSLGWAITNELGDTATVQYFERGRAIYLPVRGETVILAEDPNGQTGIWRAISGGF